jgi:hypothetical protein
MAENEKETCPNPASITANCKMWRVNSGEYTTDEDSAHWGAFWEPLDVYLPESARPSCCFGDSIVFYDRTGNRLLKDFVRHYNFIGAHPHLLFLEGKWREVISGRCEYRNNHWYMRWAVATNTAMAIEANAAARLAAAERENERLQAFIDALPEKIRKCGEPGPGGINITNGVPSAATDTTPNTKWRKRLLRPCERIPPTRFLDGWPPSRPQRRPGNEINPFHSRRSPPTARQQESIRTQGRRSTADGRCERQERAVDGCRRVGGI